MTSTSFLYTGPYTGLRRLLRHSAVVGLFALAVSSASAQVTVTIDSNAGHDGWIQLDGGGGNTAFTTVLDGGGGSDGIRVGDAEWVTNADETYRSIVSFNTSVIPAAATITNVNLQLNYTGLTGTIVAIFGRMQAELRTGAFNNNLALEQADFSAGASSTAMSFGPTPPTNPAAGPTAYTLSGANAFVNKSGGANSGYTQIRLSFGIITNNNRNIIESGEDRWNFSSGSEVAANRPKLVVTYTLGTPSPTPSPTSTPSPSPTASPTASRTPSPTSSTTPSPTESPTPSPTESATPSPTESPTPSPTETESPTPSPTETPTPSPTETETPTPSPTESPSPTPSPSATPNAARFWDLYI